MKKIMIKRLVYINGQGEQIIGGTEYDGRLTDENILGSIHEVGKTAWIGNNLWVLHAGKPIMRIEVMPFYQFEKRWYEILLDAIRRI